MKVLSVEDLLQREPLEVDDVDVCTLLKGKNILVTGAAGSIGSEIVRQVLNCQPNRVVALDWAETPMFYLQNELVESFDADNVSKVVFEIADINDQVRLKHIFDKNSPDFVFHAAAFKHVPMMEAQPYGAVRNNVFGTKLLVDFSIDYNVSVFVMISTDKVVNPTSVMGATKRIAELYVQSRNSNTRFMTTRFGNVLGSNGSVVPIFSSQIEHGGPITLTHKEVSRYFMTIQEACALVLKAASMGKGRDLFFFDMGDPIKIYDLARQMIDMSQSSHVDIVEVGLRPGEKITEELLFPTEHTVATPHKKILKVDVDAIDASVLEKKLESLYQVMLIGNDDDIVEELSKIIPEYEVEKIFAK